MIWASSPTIFPGGRRLKRSSGLLWQTNHVRPNPWVLDPVPPVSSAVAWIKSAALAHRCPGRLASAHNAKQNKAKESALLFAPFSFPRRMVSFRAYGIPKEKLSSWLVLRQVE